MSRAWPVPDVDPNGSLEENARRILAVKMGEFYSYAPIVHTESAVEPLHDLRIAAKRLRYTLELFRVVFGAEGEQQIARVKAIQEALGQLHDHDVLIALIEDELKTLGPESGIGRFPTEDRMPRGAGGGEARALGLAPRTATDPTVGLRALLHRRRAGRTAHYHAFVALWDRVAAEGMRADLAALSASPIAATG